MNRSTSYLRLLVAHIWLVLSCTSGCAALQNAASAYQYTVPSETDDGWRTASLADKGMDSVPIIGLMNRLDRNQGHLIHSILIVKDGSLVFEQYFSGGDVDLFDQDLLREGTLNLNERQFTRDDLHYCASVTKSVTSLVVGIAVDKGYIPSIDAKMLSFFPDYASYRSPEKDQISVRDMLTMTTGLPFDEETHPISDSRNDAFQLFFSDDPVAFVLGRDVIHSPGTTYQYNSGTTTLLGEIVRRTTGRTVRSFAEEHLFTPLGIFSYEWAGMPRAPDVVHAAGGLYLRPRDMAKIGQLMLQDGVWNGRRVVSSDWVHQSITQGIPVSGRGVFRRYGYQWRLGRPGGLDAFWAAGWGGQYLVIVPDMNMVFVQTGGRYGGENVPVTYLDILESHILPAVWGGSGPNDTRPSIPEEHP